MKAQNEKKSKHPIINFFLHTQKHHKKWYYRGLMGNLGDKRGYIEEDKERKSKKGEV